MTGLLLALAGAALGARFDATAPGFWSKTYPHFQGYCEAGVIVKVAPGSSVPDPAPGCSWQEGPGGERQASCLLSREEAEKAAQRVRSAGELILYDNPCSTPPAELDELVFKRETLRAEQAALPQSPDALPSIKGLLAAQFASLDTLIERREASASRTAFKAVLSTATSTEDRRSARRRYDSLRAASPEWGGSMRGPGRWARTTSTPCEQTTHISLHFEVEDEAAWKVERALRALGEPAGGACSGQSHEGRLVLRSRVTRAEVQKTVAGLEGLRHWNLVKRDKDSGQLSDDVKYERLSAELRDNAGALERAPHVAALTRAEIARLEPNVQEIKALEGGLIIIARIYRSRKKSR